MLQNSFLPSFGELHDGATQNGLSHEVVDGEVEGSEHVLIAIVVILVHMGRSCRLVGDKPTLDRIVRLEDCLVEVVEGVGKYFAAG